MGVDGQSRPDLIASTKAITTQDQVHEWLTYYYEHPRPDLTVSAITTMSKQGWLKKGDSRSPVAAFLAALFEHNSDKVAGWAGELDKGPEDQRTLLLLALWIADTSETHALLDGVAKKGSESFHKYAKEIRADKPPDLLKDEISTPRFLDALWGTFFATGDARYVRRVISALPFTKAHGDTQKILIGGAANWSLTSNAVQHPKVMEICEDELRQIPVEQKSALEEVVTRARERKN